MAKLISASIDLSKIDKSKIVTKNKNGEPFKNGGKYLNVQIVLNDEADQYGNDCAIRENLTKEERDAGTSPVYYGNGKTVWSSEGAAAKSAPAPAPEEKKDDGGEDGLPF